MMSLRSRSRALAVAAAVVLPLLATPSVAFANEPPMVSNGTAMPASLPYSGGDVSVTADVTDDSLALNTVVAAVSSSSGANWESSMSQGSGDDWFGTVELPENATTDPITWHIIVRARDLDNEENAGIAGDVVVAGQPPFDATPTVSDPSVGVRKLSADGGAVELAVTATDLRGIDSVYADVTVGELNQHVALDELSGDDRYAGVFTAPKNRTTSPIKYSIVVTAMNVRGYTAAVHAGRVTVAGRPTGRLHLDHKSLHFGRIVKGSHAARTIVLRNDGADTTAPVTARITSSGSPFFIKGARAKTLRLHLRGGETATIVVRFKPSALGVTHGSLVIRRPDDVQDALSVELFGRGVRVAS